MKHEKEHNRWQAWKKLENMDKKVAKKQYTKLVNELSARSSEEE